MSTSDVDVDVKLAAGEMAPVGRLFLHRRASSASFQYTPAWLAHPQAYAIDPQLPLGAGSFHTAPEQGLFRALADTAPDRWGVELARRYERKQAGVEGRTMRDLDEAHFLLAVRDGLRQGALRLRDPDSGAYLSAEPARKRSSSTGVVCPSPSFRACRPTRGASSARSELAAASGLSVPPSRMETVAGRQVLLLERFDRRTGGGRIGYVSAMTLLEARDGDRRTYLEIAEAIEQHSTRVTDDLKELWRRAAFSILISNTDDHLRNHGFLRVGAGWTSRRRSTSTRIRITSGCSARQSKARGIERPASRCSSASQSTSGSPIQRRRCSRSSRPPAGGALIHRTWAPTGDQPARAGIRARAAGHRPAARRRLSDLSPSRPRKPADDAPLGEQEERQRRDHRQRRVGEDPGGVLVYCAEKFATPSGSVHWSGR